MTGTSDFYGMFNVLEGRINKALGARNNEEIVRLKSMLIELRKDIRTQEPNEELKDLELKIVRVLSGVRSTMSNLSYQYGMEAKSLAKKIYGDTDKVSEANDLLEKFRASNSLFDKCKSERVMNRARHDNK